MRHQPLLELDDCRAIVAASHQAADQLEASVSIAVVDSGGHLLLMERRDGASPASAEAAIAKVRSVVSWSVIPQGPHGRPQRQTHRCHGSEHQ